MSSEKLITIRPNGTKRVQTVNTLPSRTQKQFQKDCNVNNIMAKFKKTGTITHVRNAQNGVYMDLTNIPDYATALMQIKHAQESFLQIPAHIRAKFNNDPSLLISYLKNPENHPEAIKHGLLIQKPKRDEQTPNTNDATSKTPTP